MKKYKVILADPPWQQKAGPNLSGGYKVIDGKQVFNNAGTKSEDMNYPTMTLDAIKTLPVPAVSDDDCALFLWVTNAHLPNAFEIIKAWGFKYSTTLVWAKNRMGGGLGGVFRVTTEYLIYAKKGKPKANCTTFSTWFNVKRTYENGYPKNSKKPIFFHELIEATFVGDKLEMFAREQREGWDVFGNEVENSITI